MNKELTIIIVLYNSTDVVFECLQSLANFNIIIVDNGKNEKILKKLNNYINIIKIIDAKKNLGFGNGINLAFNNISTKYFLVLNPDVILNENSIIELLKISKENLNCAISAPYISTDNDGYSMLPEYGKSIDRDTEQHKSSEMLNNLKPSGNFCAQVTKGCVLLINSKHFKDVGMFTKEYFLFWEEVDLCRKFLKKKLSVIISSKALAFHKEGTSAKKTLLVYITRIYHSEKSPLYYYKAKKNSKSMYLLLMKYSFRSITYLCIFNFKNSLKNIIKLSANLSYIFFD
jgi:GT2 family glycosyltransferase